VEKAWCSGSTGHAQLGIDILVRKKDGTYEVWQSKRNQKFGPANIRAAVEIFLKHEWADQAKRFVLALACEASDPKAINEIESSRTRLAARGIAFEPLPCAELTDKLRREPEIVDDFFGRPWVEAVCPSEARARLEDRVSRFDIADIRARLRDFYMSWIAVVDPGLPIAGHDPNGQPIPSPALAQRYVLPDLTQPVGTAHREPDVPDEPPQREPDRRAIEAGDRQKLGAVTPPQTAAPQPPEQLLSVNQFLASEKQAIIAAEAGAGKTTLLRFIALAL
jgi:hypothetical protein